MENRGFRRRLRPCFGKVVGAVRLAARFSVLLATLAVLHAGASTVMKLDCQGDSELVRISLLKNSNEFSAQIKEDQHLLEELETLIEGQPESRIRAAFGAPLDKVPAGFALPIASGLAVILPGQGYEGGGKCYFLKVADIGGIVVFPRGKDDEIAAAAVYLKSDAGIVWVRSPDNFADRRAWDLKKLELFKRTLVAAIEKARPQPSP